MELKKQIKETLLEERKRKLNESFIELDDIRDDRYLVEKYFLICSKLLNEGYTINEIESLGVKEKMGSIDWSSAMKEGAISAAKEYAINFILNSVFGASPKFSAIASRILADLNPLDIIRVFKDESTCNQSFPKISDALLEAIVRYLGAGEFNVDSSSYKINPFSGGIKDMATTYTGNIFGELIRSSDISEKISTKFCKLIH
jgi:hypothetical protein